jgi:hypothetical protein
MASATGRSSSAQGPHPSCGSAAARRRATGPRTRGRQGSVNRIAPAPRVVSASATARASRPARSPRIRHRRAARRPPPNRGGRSPRNRPSARRRRPRRRFRTSRPRTGPARGPFGRPSAARPANARNPGVCPCAEWNRTTVVTTTTLANDGRIPQERRAGSNFGAGESRRVAGRSGNFPSDPQAGPAACRRYRDGTSGWTPTRRPPPAEPHHGSGRT